MQPLPPSPRILRPLTVFAAVFVVVWVSVAALFVVTFMHIADDASACARNASTGSTRSRPRACASATGRRAV